MEIEVMEVTAEEREAIHKMRVEKAKMVLAKKDFERIQILLDHLHQLGFSITLPEIGGKYVSMHHPIVKANNIILHKGW